MHSRKVKISVVIPTYNRHQLLKNCLSSLVNQTIPKDKYEIIVVDDGSNDETKETIYSFKNKNLCIMKYVKQNHKGPGAARNKGVKHSSGSIIAFIDDDCIADKRWLGEILKTFLKYKYKIVGVEGKVVTIPEKASPFTHQIENTTGGRYYTCNLAIKKKDFIKIGGFDETYPAFNDDLDLAARLLKLGRIVFNPNAIVIHPPYKMSFKKIISRMDIYKWDIRLYLKYKDFFVKMKGGNPWLVYLYLLTLNFYDEFVKYKKYLINNKKELIKFLFLSIIKRMYLFMKLPYFIYFYFYQLQNLKS